MDVGFDKAGRDQPAAEIDGLAFGREPRRIAAILPSSMPMSVNSCSAPTRRAFSRMRSMSPRLSFLNSRHRTPGL